VKHAAGVVVLLLFFTGAEASLLDRAMEHPGEWKFEISYREKYFEYDTYFIEYDVFSRAVIDAARGNSLLTGMINDVILRVGLEDSWLVNADFIYVFQKLEQINIDSLQSAGLSLEKHFAPGTGVSAGIRIPFRLNAPPDERLINYGERLNLTGGFFVKSFTGPFMFSAGVFGEKNLQSGGYLWEAGIQGAAGVVFFETEDQQLQLIIEAAYKQEHYDEDARIRETLFFLPQVAVKFYNDISMIFGVELPAYAANVYLNRCGLDSAAGERVIFTARINYLINSERRDEAVMKREVKKDEWAEKKWWQIEGVDDEMIPDSWKEQDGPRVREPENMSKEEEKDESED